MTVCRCQKWVQNTRREDIRSYTPQHLYTNYRICYKHFEDSQFMNKENRKAGFIWCALPTLFDVPNPPPKITPQRKMRTSSMPSSEKKRRGKIILITLYLKMLWFSIIKKNCCVLLLINNTYTMAIIVCFYTNTCYN